MRHWLLITLACLLAVGMAGAAPVDDPHQGLRAHLGIGATSDVGSGLLLGADYIWREALASFSYLAADDADVLTFEGSYLWRGRDDASVYYGGGLGLATENQNDQSSLIWNIVAGKEFQPSDSFGGNVPFVEARYVFGSTSGMDQSVDGLRAIVGWRF